MISNCDGLTDTKPSSKVLRPPGGGSSDIFGSDMPQTPRNVKNRMASNIFSVEKDGAVKNNGDGPRRGQKTVDSYSRLFGEPTRPITPGKNHMKSSIPFGQNTEAAAQQLLTNGNGHGHYNGKSGSVSSASSSVSSSTENLKMNGGSRSVFRNMLKIDGEASSASGTSGAQLESEASSVVRSELDCLDQSVGNVPEDNNTYTESGSREVALQTRQDTGSNPENPISLSNMSNKKKSDNNREPPVEQCIDTMQYPYSQCRQQQSANENFRNPITGLGLNGDGVGGLKPRKLKIREGNPVTGEGYKPGAHDYNPPAASVNGANQVINKNRIPPGGYSSGLW